MIYLLRGVYMIAQQVLNEMIDNLLINEEDIDIIKNYESIKVVVNNMAYVIAKSMNISEKDKEEFVSSLLEKVYIRGKSLNTLEELYSNMFEKEEENGKTK